MWLWMVFCLYIGDSSWVCCFNTLQLTPSAQIQAGTKDERLNIAKVDVEWKGGVYWSY